MQIITRFYRILNNPVYIRLTSKLTLLFITFTVPSLAVHSAVTPHNDYLGGGLPVGEGLWIIITVIFSFALNIYLRKRKHKSKKVVEKELMIISSQKEFDQQQEIFAGMTDSFSKSRIVKILKRHKKLVRILHPLNTLDFIGKHEPGITN